MELKILVWNCQGVGDRRFVRVMKDFVNQYKLSILILMEPRISGVAVDRIVGALNFDMSHEQRHWVSL